MVEAVKIWLSSPFSGFGVIRSEHDALVLCANLIQHSAVGDNRKMPRLLIYSRGGIKTAFQDKLQLFWLYRLGLVAAHTAPLEDILDRFVQLSLPKDIFDLLLT